MIGYVCGDRICLAAALLQDGSQENITSFSGQNKRQNASKRGLDQDNVKQGDDDLYRTLFFE